MLMTRLSSVITGWGGNETTCSRRSSSGLTRSTYGTTSARPGSSVRWQRPSRSTTPARACGMIRMPRATVISTTAATTMSTIKLAKGVLFLFVYQRRGALDLHDLDPGAGLEGVVLVVGAGGPDLAVQLHRAAVAVDAVDHHGRRPDQRRRSGAQLRRHVQVAPRDRSQHQQRGAGH